MAEPAGSSPASGSQVAPGRMEEAGSARKRQKTGSKTGHQEVRIRAQAPGHEPFEVSIPRAWLRSEYFEAKLERWSGSTEEPAIVFELPEGSDPAKGLTVFRSRLQDAAVNEEKQEEAGKAWDPMQWWHATDGDEATFRTSMYLFDLVLMEALTIEVIAAMKTFLVECFGTFESVAKKHGDELLSAGQSLQASKSPIPSVERAALEQMLVAAVKDTKGSARYLVDRVIAGRPATATDDEALMDMLLSAFLSSFCLKPQEAQLFTASAKPAFKKPGCVLHPSALPWLTRNIRRVVCRSPDSAADVLPRIIAQVRSCQPSVVKRWNNRDLDYTETEKRLEWDDRFVEQVVSFLADILHALLLESHRQRDDAIKLQSTLRAIARMSDCLTQTFKQPFLDERLFGVASALQSACSKTVFGVAPAPAQQLVMLSMPDPFLCEFVRGYAHYVHADLRHLLFTHLPALSEQDQEFLATADFPGLGEPLPQMDA